MSRILPAFMNKICRPKENLFARSDILFNIDLVDLKARKES